jgi:hypothetical protein
MLESHRNATRLQDWDDTIFMAEPHRVPFSRLLRTGRAPKAVLEQWPVEQLPNRGSTPVYDGTDVESYSKTARDSLKNIGTWLRTDGWMVGKWAENTAAAGVPVKREAARQAENDMKILARMIEQHLLSTDEMQEEAAPDVPNRGRAVLAWLNHALQSVNTVPSDYRLSDTQINTDALSDISDSDFEGMVRAAAEQINAPVDLMGFVGSALKRQMTTWQQLSSEASDTNEPLVSYTLSAADKKLLQAVDSFEFDHGKVETVTSFWLARNTSTGAKTDYTTRSGVFLNMGLWEKRYYQTPTSWTNPNMGGGPRGFSDVMLNLVCKSPEGQFIIYSDS